MKQNPQITLWHRNDSHENQVWGYSPCKLDNVKSQFRQAHGVRAVLDLSRQVSQPAKADAVFTSGPYLLQNVDNDTVMDVNSGDYRTIKCYRAHREQNQQERLV